MFVQRKIKHKIKLSAENDRKDDKNKCNASFGRSGYNV